MYKGMGFLHNKKTSERSHLVEVVDDDDYGDATLLFPAREKNNAKYFGESRVKVVTGLVWWVTHSISFSPASRHATGLVATNFLVEHQSSKHAHFL